MVLPSCLRTCLRRGRCCGRASSSEAPLTWRVHSHSISHKRSFAAAERIRRAVYFGKVITDRLGAKIEEPLLLNTWERNGCSEHMCAVVEPVEAAPHGIDPLQYL
jgi:hypothetical protein